MGSISLFLNPTFCMEEKASIFLVHLKMTERNTDQVGAIREQFVDFRTINDKVFFACWYSWLTFKRSKNFYLDHSIIYYVNSITENIKLIPYYSTSTKKFLVSDFLKNRVIKLEY